MAKLKMLFITSGHRDLNLSFRCVMLHIEAFELIFTYQKGNSHPVLTFVYMEYLKDMKL